MEDGNIINLVKSVAVITKFRLEPNDNPTKVMLSHLMKKQLSVKGFGDARTLSLKITNFAILKVSINDI